jgi:nicotinate-nucleotide adenylyltransferase
MPRRIGIWGGSFDPVHVGHLILAQEAVAVCGLDRLIWIPSGDPPHKAGPVASGKHRIAMVELAIQDQARFEVSDVEVSRSGKSYTRQTLSEFRDALDTDDSLSLLIGADNAVDFQNWHDPEGVLDLAEVVVLNRPGFDVKNASGSLCARMRFLKTPLFEVSSTEIRKRIKAGQPIRHWVPEAVCEYIDREGLYC